MLHFVLAYTVMLAILAVGVFEHMPSLIMVGLGGIVLLYAVNIVGERW